MQNNINPIRNTNFPQHQNKISNGVKCPIFCESGGIIKNIILKLEQVNSKEKQDYAQDILQHRKVYNILPKSPPDLLCKSKRLGLRKSPITGDNKSSPKAIFLQHRKVYNTLPKPPPAPINRSKTAGAENLLWLSPKVIFLIEANTLFLCSNYSSKNPDCSNCHSISRNYLQEYGRLPASKRKAGL